MIWKSIFCSLAQQRVVTAGPQSVMSPRWLDSLSSMCCSLLRYRSQVGEYFDSAKAMLHRVSEQKYQMYKEK